MEHGDESALANSRESRTLSIQKYEEEYARAERRVRTYNTGESKGASGWHNKVLGPI